MILTKLPNQGFDIVDKCLILELYESTDKTLELLRLYLSYDLKIEELELCLERWEYFWNDQRIQILSQSLMFLRQIKSLKILLPQSMQLSTQCSDQSFKYLSSSLSQLSQLQKLHLDFRTWGMRNRSITDQCFFYLSNAFQSLAQLTSLKVILGQWGSKNCQFTDYAIKSLFQGLPSSLQILYIDLDNLGFINPNITDYSLFSMSKALQGLTQLTQLTLLLSQWGNTLHLPTGKLTDNGLIALIDSIGGLTKLQILKLDLTEWGCYRSMIREQSGLKLIELVDNKLKWLIEVEIVLRGWILDKQIKEEIEERVRMKVRQRHQLQLQYCLLEVSYITSFRIDILNDILELY